MTDQKKEPQVIIPPEMQAKIDADPRLAEFMRKFAADAKMVMMGVDNGTYKSFDQGMSSLGYEGGPVDPHDEDLPEEARNAIEKFMSEKDHEH